MILKTINDIEKLPSVIEITELNNYLLQLLRILDSDSKISKSKGAEIINDLISYQGSNERGLNNEVSLAILEWIKINYDSESEESIGWNSGNLANLNCAGVIEFIEESMNKSNSEFEKKELMDCLNDIDKIKKSY